MKDIFTLPLNHVSQVNASAAARESCPPQAATNGQSVWRSKEVAPRGYLHLQTLTWNGPQVRQIMNHLFLMTAMVGMALASTLALAQVQPPPLPPGSAQVRVEAGLNPQEAARQVRAHHHKFHHHKDITRDDTVHGDPSQQATSPVAVGYTGPRLLEQPPLAADKTIGRIQPATTASSAKTPSRSKP